MQPGLIVTRHHVEVAGRAVHYRRSGHGPPTVLLHPSPRSSAALLPLMAMAPADRTVIAIDTPGCGDSAPLALGRPADAFDYGDALADTLTALGIERVALHGSHTGAAIAMALAVRHPHRVAALVLDGLSAFTEAECAAWLPGYLPRFEPVSDGTHLTALWSRVRDQHLFFPWHHPRDSTRLQRPLPTPAALHAGTLDLLRAGDPYRAPYEAAFRFEPLRWLAGLTMPIFVGARPDDVLFSHLDRLVDRPTALRVEPLPGDDAAWGARLWRELAAASAPLPAAPPPAAATLPRTGIGSAYVGPPAAQLHLLGLLGGTGRPLLLLHDSPGGARALGLDAGRAPRDRPVIAVDWPGHGDSHGWNGPPDAEALAVALDAGWRRLGIDAADVQGFGAGSCIAAACASLWPDRYRSPPAIAPGRAASAPASFSVPRADGGHLQAAWLDARDEAILGRAWSRDPAVPHRFGESLDAHRIHRRCVEALKEAPEASAMRAALLRHARQG